MPPHRVELTKSAERELRRLPANVQGRFHDVFRRLASGGLQAPGLNITKLVDRPRMWRVRVGDYRGVFMLDRPAIVFTTFRRRKKGYKR